MSTWLAAPVILEALESAMCYKDGLQNLLDLNLGFTRSWIGSDIRGMTSNPVREGPAVHVVAVVVQENDNERA